MKKIIIVVVAVTVFVLLYLLTGQQQAKIDKQVKTFSSSTDDSISDTSNKNKLDNKMLESESGAVPAD